MLMFKVKIAQFDYKNSIFGAYKLIIKKNHNQENKFGLKPSK